MTHDDSVQLLVQGIVVALLVPPVVPIGLGWVGVLRPAAEAAGRRSRLALLTLLSLSQLLLLAGLVSADVLGTDYSPRRYTTIAVNLVAMAATTVVAARIGGREKRVLVTAGAWLTCAWLYVAAMSSVV